MGLGKQRAYSGAGLQEDGSFTAHTQANDQQQPKAQPTLASSVASLMRPAASRTSVWRVQHTPPSAELERWQHRQQRM